MDIMNWSAVSAIISLLSLIGVVGVGGVLWGRMTERVNGLTKRADDHKATLKEVSERLTEHDVQIGMLRQWKEGFNAAARVSGGRTQDEFGATT